MRRRRVRRRDFTRRRSQMEGGRRGRSSRRNGSSLEIDTYQHLGKDKI